MSIHTPKRLDNFMLYFDRIVCIQRVPQDFHRMEILYHDGHKIRLDRQAYWNTIASILPPCMLWYPYNNLWINDMFINFIEKIWDDNSQSYYLKTKVDTLGDIIEHGISDFEALLSSRYIESKTSTYAEKEEIQDLIDGQVNLELPDLTEIFNDQLRG